MRLLLLLLIAVIVGCTQNAATEHEPADTLTSNTKISDSIIKLETGPKYEKLYKKNGKVKPVVEGTIVADNSVNIWSNMQQDRSIIHTLSPYDEVIVYNTYGDYVLVAPKKDTTKVGFLMGGWIEYK